MKELRFDATGGVWRVAFAFDPNRKGILLVAGDKSGGSEAAPQREGRREQIMTNLERIVKELSATRRKKVEARAAQLIGEEMTLQELRRARKLTQVRMAKELGVSQDGISKLEKRSDLLLSTLRKSVEAMGGTLYLVAEFPDRGPVVLSGVGEDDLSLRRHGRKRPRAHA